MKKHGQALLLFLYIFIQSFIIEKPYVLFFYLLLGIAITLYNPFYLLLFFFPFYYSTVIAKIYLISLIGTLILLRFIWHKKNLIYLISFLYSTLTLLLIIYIYNYEIPKLLIYYILSIILTLFIIYFCGIGKKKIKVLDFNMLALILLSETLAVFYIYKPTYLFYYLVIYLLLLPYYMGRFSFLLTPILYLLSSDNFILLSIFLVVFNYKSLLLYTLPIVINYGLLKANIETLDYIFIGVYILFIAFYYQKQKTINNEKIPAYKMLSNDFLNYLSSLENLISNKENLNNKFKAIYQELITNYCSLCLNKNKCLSKQDLHLSFIKSASIYNGNNTINCPRFNEIKKLDSPSNKYYVNEGIKSLLYSISNDSLTMEMNIKNFSKYLSLLDKEKIKFKNFIPSFYTKSFQIEISNEIHKSYFQKLTNLFFKEKLEYKFEELPNSFFITVSTKTKRNISFAHAILNKDGNGLSGDNFLIKKTFDKRQIFALSDGMGSGNAAYYSSKELLEHVSSMLKYHFSTTTLLNLLGYIYEIKGNYESYATLDLLQIDITNLKACLFKLGSTTSFLFSDRVRVFENDNLPLNYNDLIDSYEFTLKKNDIIILLSDGFTDNLDNEEIKQLVYENQILTTSQLVEKFCSYLKDKNPKLKDDCSIIIVKVN